MSERLFQVESEEDEVEFRRLGQEKPEQHYDESQRQEHPGSYY